MKFLEFIESEAKTANSVVAPKYTALLKVLRSWIGEDADICLYSLIDSKWQFEFHSFISNEYTFGPSLKNLSASTIRNHLNTLKSLCRTAIEKGLLPNIKMYATAPTIALDNKEYNGRSDSKLCIDELEKLLRFTPKDAHIRRIADYLILSIFLCGIDFDALSAIGADEYDGSVITLPHLGNAHLHLADTAKTIIERNKAENAPTLFGITDAEKLRNQAKAILQRLQIRNAWVERPMTVWLNAVSDFASLESLKHFISAYVNKTTPNVPDFDSLLSNVAKRIVKDNGVHISNWYALTTLHKSADKVKDLLYETDGSPIVGFDEVYTPVDAQFKKVDGKLVKYNNPAVDRLMFVRAKLPVINEIQRLMRDEGIFYADTPKKSDAPRRLSIIPAAQVENLRHFLAVNDAKRLYRQEVNAVGKKVRIKDGLYKGCEGVIVRYEAGNPKGQVDTPDGLDSKRDPITYFAVKVLGSSFFITPSIESSLIEELK